MKNLIKRSATLFVLATAAVAVVPVAAMADKGGAKHRAQSYSTKVTVVKQKVVKQKRNRYAAGHRFRKQDVVVVKNWQARGLPRPSRHDVYVTNGDDIYLAVAATLLVKALIN